MNKIFFCSFLLFNSIFADETVTSPCSLESGNPGACGDWEPFEDHKCFKLFEEKGVLTYTDAIIACKEEGGSLVSIGSKAEDDFLNSYVSRQEVDDNIWLGAKRRDNDFFWEDGKDFEFSNWLASGPSDAKDRDCVQKSTFFSSPGNTRMASDAIAAKNWVNVPCHRRNLIICQKNQQWSLEHLVTQFIAYRKKQEVHQVVHQKAIAEVKQEAREPRLPNGFIYVQLPEQSDPKKLWPSYEWVDASIEYAGLFFRIEGGSSASFGAEQTENAPHLTHVGSGAGPTGSYCRDKCKPISNGTGSTNGEWVETRAIYSDLGRVGIMRFTVTAGEVRPRNKAVRVWKRN